MRWERFRPEPSPMWILCTVAAVSCDVKLKKKKKKTLPVEWTNIICAKWSWISVSLINQHNLEEVNCFVKFKLCFDFVSFFKNPSAHLQKSSSVIVVSSSEQNAHPVWTLFSVSRSPSDCKFFFYLLVMLPNSNIFRLSTLISCNTQVNSTVSNSDLV